MAFSNLQTRIITAIFLVAAFVALLVLSANTCPGRWILLVVACAAQGLCGFEFARFAALKQPGRVATYVGVCFVPGLAVMLFSLRDGLCNAGTLFSWAPFALGAGVIAAALAATLYVLFSGRNSLEAAKGVALELYPALLLISLGGGSLVGLASLPTAPWVVSWLFLVVCLNDIAAYFGGSHFKGPRLAPAISPNKTISGSLCGIAVGVAVGIYSRYWLGFSPSILFALFLSLIVVIAAQSGDLLKSYLKRHTGVKDSGEILPGHGGLLDRLDGVLGAGPIVYLVVVWMLRF